MTEEKLFNPDLRWHPGTGEMTAAQLAAIHTRHGSAIRPIPSTTALGYDHLMADADRGALLAELNRAMEEAARLQGIVEGLSVIHAPVEVPSLGKCCKANHGVAWKRWPCKEAELMDLKGRSL